MQLRKVQPRRAHGDKFPEEMIGIDTASGEAHAIDARRSGEQAVGGLIFDFGAVRTESRMTWSP